MIGGNIADYSLQITTQEQTGEESKKTISSECLNQANWRQDAFSAQIVDQNMRQIWQMVKATYYDTTVKAQVSINQVLNE